nr:hypothetical protein [Myxococcota bacterium]
MKLRSSNLRRAATLLLALSMSLGLAVGDSGSAHGQRADEDALPLDPIARIEALDQRLAQALSDVEGARADEARIGAELQGLIDGRATAN